MWVKTFIIHLFYFFRSSYFHDNYFLIYTLGQYEFSTHPGEHDWHHLTLFASQLQRCFSITIICEWIHRLFKWVCLESSKNQGQCQRHHPKGCVEAMVCWQTSFLHWKVLIYRVYWLLCSHHCPFQTTNSLRTAYRISEYLAIDYHKASTTGFCTP